MAIKNATPKPDELLLPSLRQQSNSLVPAESAYSISAAQTRDGQFMLEAGGKHELAMQIYARKTVYAISKAGELQAHGARTFNRTCEVLDAVAESAQGTPRQRYVDGFIHYQKDQEAEQITTLYADGMGLIRQELVRRLPDGAPPKRGLLARMFGD
jgi:hypothetical protein